MQRTLDKSESQLAEVPAVRAAGAIERAPLSTPTAMDILSRAVDSGRSPEELERLIALAERMSDRSATIEFSQALAKFKADCPPVVRRAENQQFRVTRNGQQVARRYASLDDIERTIRPHLGANGLSFRWTGLKAEGGLLNLTCVVSHVGGHSESSTVSIPFDSKAGCSEQQKWGAAMTYAQRYSLIQALGLTSCDEDTDGNEPPDAEPITEHEAANLEAAILDVGGNVAAFCKLYSIERIADLPKSELRGAFAKVEAKREANKRGGK